MTLVITSYGNGALLTKVIMGVSYIMSNSNYLLLIQLVVILAGVVGLIVSHRENVTGGSVGLKLIGTLAVAGVVWSSFYLPQDTVIVYDPVNNYQTSVKNVPVPLALPMYLENAIGDGLASLYDAYMGSSGFPSSMSYNNTGFNWGSIATQQLQNVNFVNPYDQATINSYLVNCYFPAVQLGHASILDLYNSDNILQTLQQGSQTSDAFLAEIYNTGSPGGNGVDCNTAYNYIVGMVNATTSTGSVAQSYAATLDGKTQAHGLTLAQVTNNLGPAADFLLNTGLDSQQLITQMALANSLSPAFQQFSARYGVPDNNLSFGVAQTEYQQQTVWTQTAFMARIFLPILHFIMEAIIFGSFPLIFLMTLIPGFSKKAFGYIMSMLMWLTFWAPLMSILNGLSAWLISTNAFPLNVTGGNVNLNDMGYIYSNLREWSAMIGSASMTVPMLAYGLATMSSFVGAETVAGVTGAISGGINTAAQTVATEKGAQGLQNQAQNMMQNQANNAYTDPSQFDGIMENNAESVAAQRQAMSDFIHRRGMGNVESAGLAGMEYQYGANSKMGPDASGLGQLSSEQKLAQNRAVQDLANQYFGGSRQDELNTVSLIDQTKNLAGAEGSMQAWETARKDGYFKGSLEEFEQFKGDYQSKVGFADAAGATSGMHSAGLNVIGGTALTARENTVKNLLGAQAFQTLRQNFGDGWIKNGMVLGEVEKLANSNEYKNMGEAAKIGYISGALQAGEAAGYGTTGAAKETAEVNAIESYNAAATVGTKNAAYAGYAKGVNQMNDVFKSFFTSPAGSAEHAKLGQISNEFLNNSNPVISNIARSLFAQDAATYTTDQTLNKSDMNLSKSASTDKGSKSNTQVGVSAEANANLSWKNTGDTVGEVVGGILGSIFAGGSDVATEGVGIAGNAAEVGTGVALGGEIGGSVAGWIQHTWDNWTGSDRKNTATNSNSLTTSTGNTTAETIVQKMNNYTGQDPSGFVYSQIQKNSSPNTVTEPTRPAMPSPVGQYVSKMENKNNNPLFMPIPGVQVGPEPYTVVNGELVQPEQLPGSPANLALPGPSAGTPQITGATGLGAAGDDGIIVEP
jgi:hypothetical protein